LLNGFLPVKGGEDMEKVFLSLLLSLYLKRRTEENEDGGAMHFFKFPFKTISGSVSYWFVVGIILLFLWENCLFVTTKFEI
jgi:hypothetical protein